MTVIISDAMLSACSVTGLYCGFASVRPALTGGSHPLAPLSTVLLTQWFSHLALRVNMDFKCAISFPAAKVILMDMVSLRAHVLRSPPSFHLSVSARFSHVCPACSPEICHMFVLQRSLGLCLPNGFGVTKSPRQPRDTSAVPHPPAQTLISCHWHDLFQGRDLNSPDSLYWLFSTKGLSINSLLFHRPGCQQAESLHWQTLWLMQHRWTFMLM